MFPWHCDQCIALTSTFLTFATPVGLESKTGKNPKDFESCSSLKETLELLLFHYHMLDTKDTVWKTKYSWWKQHLGRSKYSAALQELSLMNPLSKKPFSTSSHSLQWLQSRRFCTQSIPQYTVLCGRQCYHLFSLRRSRIDRFPHGYC